MNSVLLLSLAALLPSPGTAQKGPDTVPARMILSYDLSPDGKELAFAWHGDLWVVPSRGGAARRLTQGPAEDGDPCWSPDGERIAFSSDRDPEGRGIWTVPAKGGMPERIRFPSPRGLRPIEWSPSGSSILCRGRSDEHAFLRARLYLIPAGGGDRAATAPKPLFHANARNGRLSPDGTRLLFVRNGRPTSRKGYVGAAAAQLWLAKLSDPPSFERISPDHENGMNRPWTSPAWIGPSRIAYVAERGGVRNLFVRNLETGKEEALTRFGGAPGTDGWDDGVLDPRLSRDGRTAVFRYRFDLRRLDLRTGEIHPIRILVPEDPLLLEERKTEKEASAVAFAPKGREMAFIAGGDLWVMDRILKEPVRITASPEEEGEPLFGPRGDLLFFRSDMPAPGGRESVEPWPDIWVAERENPKLPWFRQKGFRFRRLTHDRAEERNLALSPDGKRLAFVREGDLYHCALDGKNPVLVQKGWDRPSYDWSPDGRWIVVSRNDSDFNRDIWILDAAAKRKPVNLSRHPADDSSPKWSPDGRRIVWVGSRTFGERDLFWVELDPALEEETPRDRKLREAMKAFEKKKGGKKASGAASKPSSRRDSAKKVKIRPLTEEDLAGAWERVHRLSLPGSRESSPIWSRDGKKCWFESRGGGKEGLYEIVFPDKLEKPRQVLKKAVKALKRLPDGDLYGLAKGLPAFVKTKGFKLETFGFEARSVIDWRARRVAVLRQAWRTIGAHFYDAALNNRDWNLVYARYREVAPHCLWPDQMTALVNQMLGELNGSHLGFFSTSKPGRAPRKGEEGWEPKDRHLGLLFDRRAGGPGLLVRRVLAKGPATLHRSRIHEGERLLEIGGRSVEPGTDLTPLLRNYKEEPLELLVQARDGSKRKVSLVPVPVTALRTLLYEDFVERNRTRVEKISKGRLGYVHIRGMNWRSFLRLEREIYSAGVGKEGLLIDVRFNGGGSTADHVLTLLCQPSHAYTIPRGASIPGYPQDRRVYATWTKPIVLLCNERSFSNAEIISHAIKTLRRGPIVGERTAGGVISTGGTILVDGSFLRLPFRGWYVGPTGRDMELNGCMPDHRVPATPADEIRDFDRQLMKAVEVGLQEVEERAKRPRPVLIPRSRAKH